MPIVSLFGHRELQSRLAKMVLQGTLPASLLLQGPRGVGKQRLALWLGQLLLCASPLRDGPCNACQSCRFARELTHPDLHWFFPRPRLKDSDADPDDVREDYADTLLERALHGGLYPPASGSEGIYVHTVRAIVQQAALSPAVGKQKVFIIGDAERMVPQEGSEQAANAFLKLLEEPPANAVVILTSSESGALLPTIRSRVVAMQVPPVDPEAVRAFLLDPVVTQHLLLDGVPDGIEERVMFAAGAPGRLLGGSGWTMAQQSARKMLDAVSAKAPARYEAAWAQASAGARGHFADTLDALTTQLHDRARQAATHGTEREALAAARAIEAVEIAKERVASNASPQLVTVNLLRELQTLFA